MMYAGSSITGVPFHLFCLLVRFFFCPSPSALPFFLFLLDFLGGYGRDDVGMDTAVVDTVGK